VRNSALRVLAAIASEHPHIAMPLEPALDALHYPAATDRNKAAAIVLALAERADSETCEGIRAHAGDVLEAMSALRQPNNADYARRILSRLRDVLDTDRREHR
ncbi:MAG TPA: hypothetical protein VK427_19135, partial [Kofleriaceae bacterium]|nr:hypothetical protein [Kofleriaceae bacterium]